MSSILALLCVGWFALAAAWSVHAPAPYSLDNAEVYFKLFVEEYQKNYANEYEKQARFQIFKQNLEMINSLNERSKHTVFGITQFSDLSREEFKSRFGSFGIRYFNFNSGCTYVHDSDINYNDAPESWDWREHGAVTPVKDQKQCQSCYAFSTTGNIEGQYAIKHGQLVSLSEQLIVDCDQVDEKCKGGLMSQAMRWLIGHGGSMLEADYPYEGVERECRFDANKVKVQLSDCRSFNLTSQEKLKQLLYHNGPISIAIKDDYVQSYTGGIIDDHFCDEGPINHGVLLVGYGSENGVPYWIVKNSWGKFGEQGYIRMHRGENYHSCGMLNDLMASAIIA